MKRNLELPVATIFQASFYFSVAVYLLAFPAWILQGRLILADNLIPFEAGFCTFLSIVSFAMFTKICWRIAKNVQK